jgi:hypothetical protein
MAFRGKDSKKQALEPGIDIAGRLNYFSRKKNKQEPLTRDEAQPLRGAVQELAAVVAAMDEEQVQRERKEAERQRREREKQIIELEAKTKRLEGEITDLAKNTFRQMPVEVKMDPDSFNVLYDTDFEDYEDSRENCELDGKMFLGSGEDKIELDVQHRTHARVHSNTVMSARTTFSYDGVRVFNARDLYNIITQKG